MTTRREAIRGGLCLASISGSIGLSSICRAAGQSQPGDEAAIDALFVDEYLAISTPFTTFIRANRGRLPVVSVRLDSRAHADVKRAFDRYQVIAGISSGASLFCLERIAWAHDLRITGRSEHCFRESTDNVCNSHATTRALQRAIILGKPSDFAAPVAAIGRAYRPSRTDDTLHTWIMQKKAARHLRDEPREI